MNDRMVDLNDGVPAGGMHASRWSSEGSIMNDHSGKDDENNASRTGHTSKRLSGFGNRYIVVFTI